MPTFDVSVVQTLTFGQAAGDDISLIIRQLGSQLSFYQTAVAYTAITVPTYGSIQEADAYFTTQLGGQRWMNTETSKKQQALVAATKRIDRLNFIGLRADPSQPLQFPRGTDTTVPVAIREACYELAQALLKGVDADTERDNLRLRSSSYGGLRSEFDRSAAHPYIAAGIPSATAWDLLWPYIRPLTSIELVRVD